MKNESKSARRGPPVWVVIGFLLAFGATIVTVILTGLFVRAPGTRAVGEDAPTVSEREAPAVRNEPAEPAARTERAVPAQ